MIESQNSMQDRVSAARYRYEICAWNYADLYHTFLIYMIVSKDIMYYNAIFGLDWD